MLCASGRRSGNRVLWGWGQGSDIKCEEERGVLNALDVSSVAVP